LPPHEIVVIDDGSDDDTVCTITDFGTAVRLVRQARGGKSKALNSGLSVATGDAVIVLDDDDILPLRALELHATALTKAPGAHFSYGRFSRFRDTPPALTPDRDDPTVQHVPIDDPRRTVIKLLEFSFLPHPTWMVRRSALEEAGPYDEKAHRSQDFDMVLRLARNNEGVFVDEVVLFQRQHDGVRPGILELGLTDANSAWKLQNQSILRQIAQSWPWEDFRPFVHAPFPAHAERTAWLQKAVILFTHNCYSEALDALMSYRQLLADDAPDQFEINIASRMLLREIDCELLNDHTASRAIRSALRNGQWHLDLRRAFVGSARWHIRAALKGRDFRRAIDLTRFLIHSFGPVGAAIGLASNLAAKGVSAGAKIPQ
jgi:glycosyltransferase involved in cell wall biosynthesis